MGKDEFIWVVVRIAWSAQICFCERWIVREVDRDLHNFDELNLFHIFAYAFEECDCTFCPNIIFCKMFANFDTRLFAALPKPFQVEKTFPAGRRQLLGLDSDGLSGGFGSSDGGVVGLQIGEEGLEVSEKDLEGLFGGVILSFDVGIDLLEDLNFLGVGKVVFGTVRHLIFF